MVVTDVAGEDRESYVCMYVLEGTRAVLSFRELELVKLGVSDCLSLLRTRRIVPASLRQREARISRYD